MFAGAFPRMKLVMNQNQVSPMDCLTAAFCLSVNVGSLQELDKNKTTQTTKPFRCSVCIRLATALALKVAADAW